MNNLVLRSADTEIRLWAAYRLILSWPMHEGGHDATGDQPPAGEGDQAVDTDQGAMATAAQSEL